MHAVDPIEEALHTADAERGVVDLFRAMIADLDAQWREGQSAQSHEGEPVAEAEAMLGTLVDRLDERAFGLLLLLLALPCVPPFVYLLPQIVALPMLALAGQMAAGRQSPWFPSAIRDRRLRLAEFTKVLDFSERYVRWFEAIARPRLPGITGRTGARITGALLLIPAASVLAPFPGTNTVPGIGIAIAALGLVQRDGLLVILGLVIGLAWVSAFLFFAIFFGVEFATFLKDWVGSLF
ncbi:MAG: exopolysaccharide biosynthesis protein [Parvularculaceae bacterium]|nr:exopolysaccharide biosynthesis protein [Parvularculaceae bacterium]